MSHPVRRQIPEGHQVGPDHGEVCTKDDGAMWQRFVHPNAVHHSVIWHVRGCALKPTLYGECCGEGYVGTGREVRWWCGRLRCQMQTTVLMARVCGAPRPRLWGSVVPQKAERFVRGSVQLDDLQTCGREMVIHIGGGGDFDGHAVCDVVGRSV